MRSSDEESWPADTQQEAANPVSISEAGFVGVKMLRTRTDMRKTTRNSGAAPQPELPGGSSMTAFPIQVFENRSGPMAETALTTISYKRLLSL